jgi:uncharacterized OB-fold protein
MRPVPDAGTAPYWEGVSAGELRLQRCDSCGLAVFYPRAVCPHCGGGSLHWFTAAGTGTVYSCTVVHRAFGEFASQAPFVVALVDLDEGVRMMTRITGPSPARPGAAYIGQRVRMEVTRIGDADLPCFRPVALPPRQTRRERAEER